MRRSEDTEHSVDVANATTRENGNDVLENFVSSSHLFIIKNTYSLLPFSSYLFTEYLSIKKSKGPSCVASTICSCLLHCYVQLLCMLLLLPSDNFGIWTKNDQRRQSWTDRNPLQKTCSSTWADAICALSEACHLRQVTSVRQKLLVFLFYIYDDMCCLIHASLHSFPGSQGSMCM